MFNSIYHIKFNLLYDLVININSTKSTLNEIMPLSIKLLILFRNNIKYELINNILINFYFIIKLYKFWST